MSHVRVLDCKVVQPSLLLIQLVKLHACKLSPSFPLTFSSFCKIVLGLGTDTWDQKQSCQHLKHLCWTPQGSTVHTLYVLCYSLLEVLRRHYLYIIQCSLHFKESFEKHLLIHRSVDYYILHLKSLSFPSSGSFFMWHIFTFLSRLVKLIKTNH